MTVVNHVLSPFSQTDLPLIETSIDQAVAALEDYLKTDDFINTMNKFNSAK